MPKTDAPIVDNIVTHAWNADRTQCAIAPNTKEVFIYETKGSDEPETWTKIHTLDEHDGFVSGIDWCPVTNRIATCGHDRNAYIWDYVDGKWQHGLVILRISRAATSIKWSSDGRKLAVTSGAKCVPVCSFKEKQNFWVSKHIKKGFKSTVLALDWCVNNKFIVTGATDFKCRIHSAFMANLDNGEDDGFGTLFPEQHKFGALLAQFDQAKAWVNTVAWSPSGMKIAFAGHGGTLHFVDLANDLEVQTIFTEFLPYLDLQFLSDDVLLAGGFDMNPMLFANDGTEYQFVGKVDKGSSNKKEKKSSSRASTKAAFNMFQGMAKRGTAKKSGKEFKSRHQNAITGMTIMKAKKGKFMTVGLDGRILFWNMSKLEDAEIKATLMNL